MNTRAVWIILLETRLRLVAACLAQPPERWPDLLFTAVDDLNDWINCLSRRKSCPDVEPYTPCRTPDLIHLYRSHG